MEVGSKTHDFRICECVGSVYELFRLQFLHLCALIFFPYKQPLLWLLDWTMPSNNVTDKHLERSVQDQYLACDGG